MAHDDQPGDVRLPAGAEVPPHASGDVVAKCRGTEEESCTETVVIDRSSLGFIAGAAGLDRDEVLLCDEHLNVALDSLTLDLSIGSAHTRSQEFEQKREERRERRKEAQRQAEKDEAEGQVYDHIPASEAEHGVARGFIKAPASAKSALKGTEWEVAHVKYDTRRTGRHTHDAADDKVWGFDLPALDYVVQQITSEGYEVEIDRDVRAAAEEAKRTSDRDWSEHDPTQG